MTSQAARHEVAAQKAAELAYEELVENDEQECCCTTCVVRVILEAAWPNLLEAAREEATTRVPAVDAFDGDAAGCESGRDVLAISKTVDPVYLHPRKVLDD